MTRRSHLSPQSTGSQESLFFMAALQLLEARADARRGMLRGDGGVGSDGMSDAGTDDDGSGMPSFASPSPVSRRSDDNSSSDVVMTGYLSKHSDFHWKSKYVAGVQRRRWRASVLMPVSCYVQPHAGGW